MKSKFVRVIQVASFFTIFTGFNMICAVAHADDATSYGKSPGVTVKAINFSGHSDITKEPAKDCSYTYLPRNNETVKIFLNADNKSHIDYAVEIPVKDLPLNEGYVFKPYVNLTISYKNGHLLVVESREGASGVPLSRITDTSDIEVSPDLMKPKSASATTVNSSLFNPNGTKTQTLTCTF